MPPTRLLSGPWAAELAHLVGAASSRLTVCAPYVSGYGTAVIRDARQRGVRPELHVLTDLSPQAICSGATDPVAVADLLGCFRAAQLVHLPRVHAKVYVADGARAIVTSGNLTRGGLKDNFEMGVFVEERPQAESVERDIHRYAALGASIEPAVLSRVCALADESRIAFKAQAASASRAATRRLTGVLRDANEALLRARLSGGALHTVLARTIEFVLRQRGPLSTPQIHDVVQRMHPDLCDDNVDRVIDGKRYGKKWKHAIRTAQQQLKKAGVVAWSGGTWALVDHGGAEAILPSIIPPP